MPLHLVAPRHGKSSNWTVKGSHLGVFLNKSAGTPDKRLAARMLAKFRTEIENGTLAETHAPNFADAVTSYIGHGGARRFVSPLLEHFKTTPLRAITQQALDHAAIKLYPNHTPATRNRQVYTPVSAILRHAGEPLNALRRPKGSTGTRRTTHLSREDAFALIRAGTQLDARFGALLTFLLYTGARLGEALALDWADVDLARGLVLIRQTKTERPRTAVLPANVVKVLDALPRGQSVFRFSKGGHLYKLLGEAAEAAGVPFPERVAFHLFRHTWATWMRRYAGLDTAALVETGAWKSRASASVYEHLDASEEAHKVQHLPVMGET